MNMVWPSLTTPDRGLYFLENKVLAAHHGMSNVANKLESLLYDFIGAMSMKLYHVAVAVMIVEPNCDTHRTLLRNSYSYHAHEGCMGGRRL